MNNLLISQMIYPEKSKEENIKEWIKQLKELHLGYGDIEKEYKFVEDGFIYYFLICRIADIPLEIIEREIDEDWHLLLSDTMKEKMEIMKKEEHEE